MTRWLAGCSILHANMGCSHAIQVQTVDPPVNQKTARFRYLTRTLRWLDERGRRNCVILMLVVIGVGSHAVDAAPGQLELRAVDAKTGEPIAVQLQIHDQRGRLLKLPRLARDGDWQLFDGTTVLKLAPGHYQFRMQRGLEYRPSQGHFSIESGAADNHQVELPRSVDMRAEGWWSGDLHVPMNPRASLPLRLLASDVHYVSAIIQDNRRVYPNAERVIHRARESLGDANRIAIGGRSDLRDGSHSILHQHRQPLDMPAESRWLPTPFELMREVRAPIENSDHLFLSRATCRDLPVWVATGQVQSLGLLHAGLEEKQSRDSKRDRPGDAVLYPAPYGVARWSQHIYFQLLESGHRIACAAGSAANENSNPLGFNRVYVHCGATFSESAWWDGLRDGRVVVTNGPLLRVQANDEYPGHTFRLTAGEKLAVELAVRLSTQQKIHYLEVIKDGRPVQQVRLEDWVARKGRLPPVAFDQSGWFLVRAVADGESGYRGAVTGPFFVEFDGRRRISRRACQFFLDWIYERARSIKIANQDDRRAVLMQHRDARDYWQHRLEVANVE